MSDQWQGGDFARETYELMASVYDEYVHAHRYDYEGWTAKLLAKAEEAGLTGKRLLDVGCGTGLSFIPMLDRGWEVTACDLSPEMLKIAREKAGDRAELLLLDMRELPKLGEFDLAWALNEPINYMLSEEELTAALMGMRRNLAPGGVVIFDALTLAATRGFLGGESVLEKDGRRFIWKGDVASPEDVLPGSVHTTRLEIEGEGETGPAIVHQVRHFTEAQMLAAIKAAGLQSIGVFGEKESELYPGLDEGEHTQAAYLCRL